MVVNIYGYERSVGADNKDRFQFLRHGYMFGFRPKSGFNIYIFMTTRLDDHGYEKHIYFCL